MAAPECRGRPAGGGCGGVVFAGAAGVADDRAGGDPPGAGGPDVSAGVGLGREAVSAPGGAAGEISAEDRRGRGGVARWR